MIEKHEWRKDEKIYYNPSRRPQLIDIPAFKFFTLSGKGNPNEPFFAEYIQCLYSLSYSLKMSLKKESGFDYTVYPLEGIWDLPVSVTNQDHKVPDKNSLLFHLMIRQPDDISDEYATDIINKVKQKKPHHLLEKVRFETISDGPCVQMLHTGSYDDEPSSFAAMDAFVGENHLERASLVHREIYLSDARKVQPDKLKTILRYQVK